MEDALTIKEIIKNYSISEKLLKSYTNVSNEIPYFKEKNRYYINKNDIENWLLLRKNRKIILSIDEYRECLEFAFKINYAGHTRSDFGTARTRGIMQAISNWTQGTLAETALRKFLLEKYNIKIDLDFNIHDAVVGQDITQVQRGKVINPPRIRVSIKSGKINSCYLVVPENEVDLKDRRSDLYIFIRVDFPEDHLLRVLKDHKFLENVKKYIPDLGKIETYICGFSDVNNLEKVNEIPGVKFSGMRYVSKIGKLKNSDNNWQEFVNML